MGRRILITGIAAQLAQMIAARLARTNDVDVLVGVDTSAPALSIDGLRFVRSDLRNPIVARLIDAERIDTVMHLATMTGPKQAGSRARMKEHNVLGAMQLFAACQRAESVNRIVLKSTTAVYGSDFTDPGAFREDQHLRKPPTTGYAKDAAEVESYARATSRRRDGLGVVTLRFANFLGPTLDSTMGAFFQLPVFPTVLGYDPRLQFCHEDDALAVLEQAALGDVTGTFNVGGEGVLFLSQCARIAGRIPIPVPQGIAQLTSAIVRQSGRVDFSPEQLKFLQFGRVGDLTRLREKFGYEPIFTTREAFEDHVARRHVTGIIDNDAIARWERKLYDFVAEKGLHSRAMSRWGMA